MQIIKNPDGLFSSRENAKETYRHIVEFCCSEGTEIYQPAVEAAENYARALFPYDKLILGCNPPRDPRVISLLPDILSDPLWDKLGESATAEQYTNHYSQKNADTECY